MSDFLSRQWKIWAARRQSYGQEAREDFGVHLVGLVWEERFNL
jgi:hypothetical protein